MLVARRAPLILILENQLLTVKWNVKSKMQMAVNVFGS